MWETEEGCRFLYNSLPEILSRLSYTHLHPISRAHHEFDGKNWQLVTAIHDVSAGNLQATL
jgi:hypothetical protein